MEKHLVRHVYIPLVRGYENNKGLSERLIKDRLIKDGWEVWRGGALNVLREAEIYPNVERKYNRLKGLMGDIYEHLQYICRVHHGMPDFLCYRGGFKFVECKLGHEQLSCGQKKCILLLRKLGFEVEVHKLVFDCTKDRIAYINLKNGEKVVKEKQMRLKW